MNGPNHLLWLKKIIIRTPLPHFALFLLCYEAAITIDTLIASALLLQERYYHSHKCQWTLIRIEVL